MRGSFTSIARAMVLLLAALTLSACLLSPGSKSMQPLSDGVKQELASKGLAVGAPLYVRIFKQENVLEVWLGKNDGTYTLFRTYKICSWSGDLGPKTREGDKQAPEGFYIVTAKQMNPNSNYYLSFNLGYPNAYDRSHGYTGQYLMVHGGCKSVGCYAIRDDNIQELYVLAREAFTAGQHQFPVHAFPFYPSDANMIKYAGNRWYPFWLNLKQGNDLFEQTMRPPVVGVKDGVYVFFPDNQSVPPEYLVEAANGGATTTQLITGWAR
ncbi:MAG: murein L,D-transpeptidase family protein [Hyphomicrobiales bacterium]